MLDKKQIWVIFLFEFKMGCETVEATCNINNTFGSEAAKEQTVQWWVKKFCKGDESLEGKEQSRQPSEVDNNQLRGSSRQILLQWHRGYRRTRRWSFYGHTAFEASWKGEKSSISGCLMSRQNQKKTSFWRVVFSYSVQQQRTISRLGCDMQQKVDFIQQPATTSSVVGLRKSSKALRKANLATRKGQRWLVCFQSDWLQLSEFRWNYSIWKVCSANQWDAP